MFVAEKNRPLSPERIMQLGWAHTASLMVEAALKHGVFDHLNTGPKTLEQLTAATGASSRGMRALLNGLVAIDLLDKGEGSFRLTEESATFLVSSRPAYQGALFKHVSDLLIPCCLKLSEVVKTGKPPAGVNQQAAGMEFFAELVEGIFPMSWPATQILADHLGLPAASAPVSVLDLATGSGVWGIGLAKKSPHVRVTAVDWPDVLPVARRVAEKHGVADRFTFVPGDVLQADFGQGHHVATLGHIVHSEGEERSVALFAKTFAAMAPGGTIAVAEFLPDEDRRGPPSTLMFAINMLVNTEHGDTFTFGEISSWLERVGFEKPYTLENPGPAPLILATKPR